MVVKEKEEEISESHELEKIVYVAAWGAVDLVLAKINR